MTQNQPISSLIKISVVILGKETVLPPFTTSVRTCESLGAKEDLFSEWGQMRNHQSGKRGARFPLTSLEHLDIANKTEQNKCLGFLVLWDNIALVYTSLVNKVKSWTLNPALSDFKALFTMQNSFPQIQCSQSLYFPKAQTHKPKFQVSEWRTNHNAVMGWGPLWHLVHWENSAPQQTHKLAYTWFSG